MPDFDDARHEMVATQIAGRGVRDPRLLDAFLKIPRHLFVREDDVDRAYTDHPLAIGHGQTISQPYIVALSLQQLDLRPTDRVLEIGTGSGYQTALLSTLARDVFTIERLTVFDRSTRDRLEALGCANVRFRIGDGTLGWPEEAPFDRIVVSAAAPAIPAALEAQLAPGGRLVVPVGGPERQQLTIVRRTEKGLERTNAGECLFVKLYGQGGWREERPEK